MIYKNYNKATETTLNRERLIADEVSRLTRKYGKSFLDCENLIELTGLRRDNVRAFMHSKAFPVTKGGIPIRVCYLKVERIRKSFNNCSVTKT